MSAAIDPNLDFASFYENGGDPDRDSERLYLWHLALWARTVPGVGPFELEVSYDRGYGMRVRSADGAEFWVGSDRMIPTWSTPGWTYRFAPDLSAEIAMNTGNFQRIASTIGGYVVFPRNRAGQTGWAINQSRGMHSSIADRFDLTLECIRRHYCDPGAANPLGERLDYYDDFFALFRDFDTYVRSMTSSTRLATLSAPSSPATRWRNSACLRLPSARRTTAGIASKASLSLPPGTNQSSSWACDGGTSAPRMAGPHPAFVCPQRL